jgi:PD-(D/E)XK nuclease superfamily
MTIAWSDRSRLVTYQECPRRRYLAYEWGGTGIQRIRQTIPLATGIYTHVGLADILRQVLALGDVPHAHLKVDVEQAVKAAVGGYREELKVRGLDVELGEDGQAVADEQVALVEGLLRAYVKAPTGLEALLGQYRVVEVEREDVWEGFASTADGTRIDFQARADALLQERSSGDLYVLSFKTAAGQDYRKDNEGRHDVQGLSEVAVVERRLRIDWERFQASQHQGGKENVPARGKPALNGHSTDESILQGDAPPRIMGVQMVYLIKGIRRQAYDGGPYVTSSPLLRGFYKEGITEREYAWKEETPCPGPGHVLSQGKRGPILCEGKKYHKLGQGWTKFDTYKDLQGGVAEWVDMLSSGTIQPDAGNPFDSVVWQPMPYFRQDSDMKSWIRQAQSQERDVAERAKRAESARTNHPDILLPVLDEVFHQYRRSCDWPSQCQFVPICWGDESALTNPMSTGLFQLRTPHHQAELAAQTKKVSK